ncbi:MAG: 30S ribosomal protein S2 [Candidatus Sungbacteria bacterium]|nr:30S ribosomal protein S2 [Candidatus Sungbacteria bacterium]
MPEIEEQLKLDTRGDEELQTLMKAGIHIGHVKAKTHPAMRPFIFATRNNIQIIDVTKTRQYLARAEAFLKDVATRGGMILWVGTKPSARLAVEEAAEKTGMPHTASRWIGGLLTNFKVISKRIAALEDIERRMRAGDLEKYTKQERARIGEEYQRLLRSYNGARTLKRLPDALVVVDILHDSLALEEAHRLKIPVVGLADTNSNPNALEFPIPSNDDARLAIQYMMSRFAGAVLQGIEEVKRAEAADAEKKADEVLKTKD